MGDAQGINQDDDVFSFFTAPYDSGISAATPSTLFNRCSYSSSSSSADESHPLGDPSVDDSNKRIDYMIQFLDQRLSEDGTGATENNNGGDTASSGSLPEFVGKCGGTGIFQVPMRSAVHPNRPPSLEVRPHPLREGQIGRFLRTMTSTGRELWAGGEDGGLKVWNLAELGKSIWGSIPRLRQNPCGDCTREQNPQTLDDSVPPGTPFQGSDRTLAEIVPESSAKIIAAAPQ